MRSCGECAAGRRLLDSCADGWQPAGITPDVIAEKLEQLRALYIGCRMKVIQAEHAGIGIDVPEDIARAEEMLLKLGLETDSLA